MYRKILFSLSFTVFCSVAAVAQNTSLSVFKTKLEDYKERFPEEKLFVHTDKSFYTAGDIVWFKIYNCADSIDTLKKSKVVYVEILNEHNSSVLQAKISTNKNGGDGSFELPLNLNSGIYIFRAYTNWMKNFGAEQFFQKQISIINPFKSLPPAGAVVAGSIDLFPEGGNLVSGMLSQIGFKINGSRKSAKGFVIDENNDTVTRFEPFKFGLGSFYLTPDIQHRYKAVLVFDDNSFITKALPPTFPEGYVMHLDEENEKLTITVRTNDTASSEIYLIVQNYKRIKVAKQSSLTNNVAIFSVEKADLGVGVSQLTVFNESKQPVCERLFFVRPSGEGDMKITGGKDIYSNREKVQLSLSTPSTDSSNISVSVFQLDSLQNFNSSDITSYFWLESELNGKIENPQYYLSGNSEEIKKTTDHLLLTHGWRRFNWNAVLNQSFAIKFEPENLGQTITCKVTDPTTGKPVKGIKVFLSIPESSYKLYPGISNDSGIVYIRANEYFGKGEVIVQTVERNDNYKIEIVKPFSEQFTPVSNEPFVIDETRKALLENYSISMQSQYIYTGDSIQKFLVPALKDSLPFFGRGQSVYMLDDYTRFTTMEEVLREYVREINVGVRGGNLKFKLLNEVQHEYFSDNILVMIDGVPMPNPDKMFAVDPMKIRRIDIFPRSYVVGPSLFFGLANFSTYKENHENIDIDPKAIVMDYEGLQIKREFYSPDYSTPALLQSRLPDLRNTLYWSPDVTDKEIRFYTGDNKGRYIVVVQGLNNKGEPVSSVSQFEVR